MKALKIAITVAIGISAIIGVLMSDDIYALIGVPTAATF